MAIALVTNVLAPYRVPLYALLAERYGVEVLCFGAGASYVPAWFGDLDRQLAAAPFPARRLGARVPHSRSGAATTPRSPPSRAARCCPRRTSACACAGGRSCCGARVWAHPRGDAKAALGFPLVRHVYRHADAVVTYGAHVRRYVARYRGRDDDVVIAPQSVEAELFGRPVGDDEIAAWRAEAGLPADGPLVLYVGRLVPEKGIEDLLAAWRLAATTLGSGPSRRGRANLTRWERVQLAVLARCPAARAHGPPSSRSATARSPPRSRRRPAPACSARSPASACRSRTPPRTLLVLPSIPTPRFREPWGLVCNEALHQGTPVVATTAVGAVAGGLVRDGETGPCRRRLATDGARGGDPPPARRRAAARPPRREPAARHSPATRTRQWPTRSASRSRAPARSAAAR